MSKKKVTAPLTYNPGKGRPKEHLAYLNWQEMEALKRLNGNNQERGPKGLPSFPPADARGSSSKASSSKSSSKSTGARGPTGPKGEARTSPAGGKAGSISRSAGVGSERSSSRDVGVSSSSRASSNAKPAKAVESKTQRESSKPPYAGASQSARGLAKTERKTVNVGPMGTPVSVKKVSPDAKIKGAIERIKESSATQQLSGIPVPRPNPLKDPSKFKLKNENILNNVDAVALGKLVRLQEEYGSPLTITSGHRNPLLNKRVGGAGKSQHIQGNAIDIAVPGASAKDTARLIDAASGVGFSGIGGYRPGKIHVDVGSQRVWGPSYGKESISQLPKPMQQALQSHATGKTPKISVDYSKYEGASFAGLPDKSVVPASLSLPASPSGGIMNLVPDRVKIGYMNQQATKLGRELPGMIAAGAKRVKDYFTGAEEERPVETALTKEQQESVDAVTKRGSLGIRGAGVALGAAGLPAATLIGGRLAGGYKANVQERLEEYAKATPEQKLALEKKDPALIGWGKIASIQPESPYSDYQSWATERGLRGAKGSERDSGIMSIPTQTVAPTPTASTVGTPPRMMGNRPESQYYWDLGVNIPTPADPNYTQYQEYLRQRAAAQAAMYGTS